MIVAFFLRHFGSDPDEAPHLELITGICGEYKHNMASMSDFVHNAIATLERERIPLIGMATTRRALRTLVTRYNDKEI